MPSLADVPVVVLAGGLGTRLRAVLPDRPKGLAPVGGRSFLEIQIELLREQGARRFVLCVGHQAAMIEEALGDGGRLGVAIEYSVEGETLLGTAGALRRAGPRLRGTALVLNGDTYFAIGYGGLLQQHLEEHARSGALATLAVVRMADAAPFGTVTLDASGRRVVAFREKDPAAAGPAWVSAGAYVIEPQLLELIPADQPSSLERDVFPQALARGRVLAAATSDGRFFDIGTPDALEAFVAHHASLSR